MVRNPLLLSENQIFIYVSEISFFVLFCTFL